MENNQVYLNETPEQTVILDEIMTMMSVVVSDYVKGTDPLFPPLDDLVAELYDYNLENFSATMAYLHIYFGLELEYEIEKGFETFPTLGDAFQYLGEKVLKKQGLWYW